MPRRVHRLSQIDPNANSGLCKNCGVVHLIKRWRGPVWTGEWQCSKAFYIRKNNYRKKWYKTEKGRAYQRIERFRGGKAHRLFVRPICERCGFVPINLCQIDIHHKDGNHLNDDPSNLQSVCSNCHRLDNVKRESDFSLTSVGDYEI